MTEFNEMLIHYKNMSVSDKREENLRNLKIMIAYLDSICTKKNLKYRDIRSKEILDLKSGTESEADYLEAQFVYINLLKEMLGSYLDETIK